MKPAGKTENLLCFCKFKKEDDPDEGCDFQ